MSVMIRRSWPAIFRMFINQNGPVCLGDVDGKSYLADLFFFQQCKNAEIELQNTILLKEGELIIEDAESGETPVGKVSGTAAG